VNKQKLLVNTVPLPGVKRLVRDVLDRSPAFRQLSAIQQQDLTANMEKVAARLAVPEGMTAASVDFPFAVRPLINGVFEAIVNSSIRQMEAYADLMKDISASVDDFSSEDDDGRRDFICSSLAKKMGVKWPP
jgi:hypothetical protein